MVRRDTLQLRVSELERSLSDRRQQAAAVSDARATIEALQADVDTLRERVAVEVNPSLFVFVIRL